MEALKKELDKRTAEIAEPSRKVLGSECARALCLVLLFAVPFLRAMSQKKRTLSATMDFLGKVVNFLILFAAYLRSCAAVQSHAAKRTVDVGQTIAKAERPTGSESQAAAARQAPGLDPRSARSRRPRRRRAARDRAHRPGPPATRPRSQKFTRQSSTSGPPRVRELQGLRRRRATDLAAIGSQALDPEPRPPHRKIHRRGPSHEEPAS